MAVTILEALQNANYNIKTGNSIGMMFAKDQLNNAVVLLEKGYDLNDEVEPILDEYGSAEDAPDKNQ